jgi:hypothetical protein
MPLKIVCEGCGAKLSVKGDAQGRTIKCPKCGAMIGVPVERVVLPIIVEPDDNIGTTRPLPPKPSATHDMPSGSGRPLAPLKGAMRPGHWYWLAGSLVGLVGLVVCVTAVVHQTAREPTPRAAVPEIAVQGLSPGARLAQSELHKIVSDDDPAAIKFNDLLNCVSPTYNVPQIKVAILVESVCVQLREKGRDTSAREILELFVIYCRDAPLNSRDLPSDLFSYKMFISGRDDATHSTACILFQQYNEMVGSGAVQGYGRDPETGKTIKLPAQTNQPPQSNNSAPP